MCSHGGHRIAGQMAKAFSSAQIPLHLCRPGSLTNRRSALQKGSAALNEGGRASSGSAAQFMKAFTLMVWSVVGRLTSQASAVHKGELEFLRSLCSRYTFFGS